MELEEVKFLDKYEMKEDLGKGAFSIVKKCVSKASSMEYAVKIILKKRLTVRDLTKLEKEERICRKLKHPNIVQLHDSISDNTSHYLIFDLVTGGELFDEIVAREYYSENDASMCMQQVLESIEYCHNNEIIHRDLKPENLLLSSKNKDAVVKLADFGLAIEVDTSDPTWYGFAGTPGYLSPEVIKREPYNHSVDMWACGVILYILLVGYPPFWDEDQKRLYSQIKAAKYDFPSPEWDTVTSDAKNLIRALLNHNPSKRITARGALNDPWISQRQRVAPTFHRQETILGLKRFNARRKLKGAILTTMLATRSSLNLFRNRVSESDIQQPTLSDRTPEGVVPIVEEADTPLSNEIAKMVATDMMGATNTMVATDTIVATDATTTQEITNATESLLETFRLRDFEAYKKMCDPNLLTFRPESSHLMDGLEFTQFTLNNLPPNDAENILMVRPRVQLLGDSVAVISYIRLNQTISSSSGLPSSTENKETRVWERRNGRWICVHVHTS